MTDAASIWERLAERPGGTVAGLATATTADGTNLVFAATRAGVYRSATGGASWTASSPSDIVPFNEVVAPSPNFAGDHTLFAGGDNGVYRSVDEGASWTRVLAGGHVTSMAVALDLVLAGTARDGILRSTDGGRGWASANPGLLDLTVLALALSPEFDHDRTGMAATASGLYRTRNGGQSWREVDLGAEVVVQCLAFSPGYASDRLMLAGTESDGLLRSDDGGGHWEPVSWLAGRSVTALVFSNHRGALDGMVAAATERGIAFSSDRGQSWRIAAADIGSVLSLAFASQADGKVLLAGLLGDGVARVQVDSGTWTLANQGLHARLLLSLALSPSFDVDHTLFAAGPDDGVIISVDGGRSWEVDRRSPDDPSVVNVTPSPDYARDRTLFAASSAGIQRSQDSGATWQAAPGEMESTAARTILAGSRQADGSTPLFAAVAGGRLMQSDDEGKSWRQLGESFASAEIVSIALSPAYMLDRTLFVGTSRSVLGEAGELTLWKSVDAGASWQRWLVERGGDLLSVAVSRNFRFDEKVLVAVGGRILQPVRHTRETWHGEQRPMWREVRVGGHGTVITGMASPPGAGFESVIFAATSDGVYVSRDGGDHFLPSAAGDGPKAVIALAISPDYAHDRSVYALGLGGTLWRRQEERHS